LRISVVTVCYNSEKTIRDTINSVLTQAYPNIEYIVVDGGSTDGTLSIIEEYEGRITKVISEPDSGIYDAMNKGVKAATGEIVGILNSDDFFEDETVLRRVASVFERRKSVDLVFGDVVFVKPDDVSSVVRYYGSKNFRPWKLRFGWMPPHPSTFVRRTVYECHGLYSMAYKIAADYEIFVRWLLVEGLRYDRIDRVLVRMRAGGVSTSGLSSSIILNREIVWACKSNGIYTNLLYVLSKIPFKLLEVFGRRGRLKNEESTADWR
jgi:glycosyltransferase involved in cell wall biosynthesis